MKSISTIILLVLLTASSVRTSAQGAEKTLVKSFNLAGNQVVELQLEGNVEVKEWNNSTVRVQITIGLPDSHPATLKSLVQAGRYQLRGATTTDAYRIAAPNLQKQITIGGQPLREQISYLVYAPANVLIKLIDSTTANALNTAKNL